MLRPRPGLSSRAGRIGVRNCFRGDVMLKTISIVAGLFGLAAALPAQTYPDTYKIDYYSTAIPQVCDTVNQQTICQAVPYDPDSTVRLTNAGTQIGSTGDPSGNLCAMIYVFAPDQQMAECC